MAPLWKQKLERNWYFKQADKDDDPWLPVSQFPTNIHLDLLHHKKIPDPYVGKNELDVQWVGETAWVYKTMFPKFEVPPGHLVDLVFDGLDTFATVVLNGTEILKSDNMFISNRVAVGPVLQEDNELIITFDSAYLRGCQLVADRPSHKWICSNGDASRLPVRKAQYHWGWDWGPTLLTCGPWRPVTMEVYEARIDKLTISQVINEDYTSALVGVRLAITGNAFDDGELPIIRFDIYLDVECVASQTLIGHSATLEIDNPALWYPIRYGKQPLYTITVTLFRGRKVLDKMSRRFGLRKVQLVQQPFQDEPGTSFFLKINDVPIFCGGSNWIPADSFLPRISPKRYLDWVKLVAAGNQCMIRVWGGGIYEDGAFYDACDKLGILVWQDFMFACGNYPSSNEFLRSVEAEARQTVIRLRDHPSIVIWAGNNEDYQIAHESGLTYDTNDHDHESWLETDFPARYIYEVILDAVCRELTPNTPYHYGSPWGGKDPGDPTVGDIHQWQVWHGAQERYQDFDKLIGRFVSEFGMEAFPNIKTIDSFLPLGKDDLDRYPQSSTVDFHNKAAGHERRLGLYLNENIRYTPEPIEYFIYCTQLMQAECISSAYRLWRRQWKGPGKEKCGGVLVWQINDCWPVTSWSICDYYMRPKYAYYTVKREMAPVTIGIKRQEHEHRRSKCSRVDIDTKVEIEIWASNLRLTEMHGCCIIKAWDVETGKETYSKVFSKSLHLPANRSTEITTMEVPVEKSGADLEARTVVAAYIHEKGTKVARFVNWPEPLKHLHLQTPKTLKVQLDAEAGTVKVSAEVPIKGLALVCQDEHVMFEDNLIDIVPGEEVVVAVTGAKKDTLITTQYLGMYH